MHILSPETDNCPSWISGRERMTVENISWSISTKECCQPRWGVEPATSWSPVGRRIQLSHRGRLFRRIFDLQNGHKINAKLLSNITKWDNAKAESSYLYETCHLVLFYISTKYHQNIPKGIRVTEWTQNLFQTKQREISPKESHFHSCTWHILHLPTLFPVQA